MVTAEQLEARRQALGESPDLQALLETIERRNALLREKEPPFPRAKALLSQEGGLCPADGSRLAFDPWNGDVHRCPRCGKTYAGERHYRNWVRYQHLWLAERSADLAAIAAFRQDQDAATRARKILRSYGTHYFAFPNADNVLGPSRLFFSTYLESLFVLNYLAAAAILRAADLLDDDTERAVTTVADEAANLIGEFDERFSNRQTWNNAALTAIAWWFGDGELADRVIQGQTGLSAQLVYGFRPDGMWYEGENYHLFALRGMLTGIMWARAAGIDFTANSRLADRLQAALMAPAVTALPDFTFPARKDSRFGVSLAHPMYLETWEVGLATIDGSVEPSDQLPAWLDALYHSAAATPFVFESYAHEAPTEEPRPPSRSRLSWWALVEMLPSLPATAEGWQPSNRLLEDQGLVILRAGQRYASLEAGIWGGGHGHPDRLSLTLFADGTHWLPDPGTGVYVSPALAWYRSTLAHNAPRLDGVSQQPGSARCEMFAAQEGWAWALGDFGPLQRALVAGPRYLIDVVRLTGQDEHVLELPWHFAGTTDVVGGGRWIPDSLDDPFVTNVERLERLAPAGDEPVVIAAESGAARLRAHLAFAGELLRAEGPGLPEGPDTARRTFYLQRAQARNVTLVAVLEPGHGYVKRVRVVGDGIAVETADGTDHHHFGAEGWSVETPAGQIVLRGAREAPQDFEPLIDLEPPERARGTAFRLDAPPALDGGAAGFDASEPLHLDLEDQYRRSEEPYPGPEEFSATALAGWDDDALYLCVDVVKRDVIFRAADAPPLKLDNEHDDIHSDGLQIYLGHPEDGRMAAVHVVPDADHTLRLRSAGLQARGAWEQTDAGYRVTLALDWPDWLRPHSGEHVPFDLIINEMLPERVRRVGQLAWSGGNGWVYLRGDRQEWGRLGILDLIG